MGEPVYLDVVTALNQAGRGDIRVVGGRYGLSSKDTTPGQFIAVYDNLKLENPKNSFTIGINDDVTHTSLDYKEVELPHPGEVSCKIWGLGGDGTVGANKNAISTIGLVANKYAQAYFSYDSMKSGGLTQSHLRFGDEPIRSTYLVSSADFVAVHAPTYVNKYDTTEDLKDGGIFLLNCPWSAEELETRLPGKMKRDLARKHANFYIIDAAKLAVQVGLGEKRTNNILQAAFFALTKVIPLDMAVEDMKKNNYNSYFKKAGQKIVDLNDKAVDLGISAAVKVEIPASWADAPDTPCGRAQERLCLSSVTSCCPWTGSRATSCLCPCSRSTACWTAPGKTAPPLSPSAAWPPRCPSGTRRAASSATAAPCAAPTPPSGPCC